LVCSVGYTTHTHEQLHLRKFFKFQVTNPLAIEANVTPIPNGYLVSAEMTNQTSAALFIELLEFSPDAAFSAKEISRESGPTTPLTNSDLPSLPIVRPSGTRQALFRLQYTSLESPDLASSNLGSLKLQWRTQLGATGVHTTDTLRITVCARPCIPFTHVLTIHCMLKAPPSEAGTFAHH
jgi:trafficking protein particle complex subunit 13